MKVAYLIGSLNRGGAETLLLDVFRKGRDVPFEMVLIHRKGGQYEEEFASLGASIYPLRPKRFALLSYLLRLRKILKTEQVSIIHAYQWIDVVYGWLATIGLRVPIVLTFHGYLGTVATGIKAMCYKIAIRMADKLCFVSGYQMEQYHKRYGESVRKKGCVVYNGIDFEKFDYQESKVDSRKSIVNSDGIKLCMVGSFNSVRNQKLIVEAMRIIDDRLKMIDEPHFDFYFIGARYKGEEWRYDECVKNCEENGLTNVHFLGNRGDIPDLLRKMDGFVYATKNDTFGIAVVEAMAAGLPVVVNDHPVMKEVCGNAERNVRYYKSKDAQDCANKITQLIKDVSEGKSVRIDEVKEIRSKYSLENHIMRIYGIYNAL